MLTKGLNPSPDIPFQHPASVRFCAASTSNATDHIQFHSSIVRFRLHLCENWILPAEVFASLLLQRVEL
jgi:hypothetical protein